MGGCRIDTAYYLATCKYYIYDHSDLLYDKRKEGQHIIFLGHGGAVKAASSDARPCLAEELYVTGKLFYKSNASWSNAPVNRMLDMGYPRLDYFFYPLNELQKRFVEEFEFNKYVKVFLWMPTFRKSINKNLSEEYFQSTTGLPIIETEEQLVHFNEFLQDNDFLCIFKIHHLQAELESFQVAFSNILIMNDDMLRQRELQLYQFVCLTDALITDYSSIASDYMLLDRPIIYTLDDYEEYSKSRGFALENAIDYFAGAHVYNSDELLIAMTEIGNGDDRFREARKKVLPLMHTHTDGMAAKRILEHIGL